ncbi:MAG: GNAT family N-acetyltransferase [Bacteroidia bacterium]|nr:GNAT family N-acetyltransferase [Bacteroidia bacterium]
MLIRKLHQSEISKLEGITPAGWSTPVEIVVEQYFDDPGFEAVVAEVNGAIAGLGHIIFFGSSAWLGNIIVREEFRSQGVGTRITQHLLSLIRKGDPTLLVATEQGYKVYSRLGFIPSSTYCFYHGGDMSKPDSENIRQATLEDIPLIRTLDKEGTGEIRDWILEKHFPGTIVHKTSDGQLLTGFYMPNFGEGLIVAKDEEAGLNLLKYKAYHHSEKQICVPSDNFSARNYLKQHAYKEYLTTPRMFFKKEVSWRPKWIYSRATGYGG